MPIVMTVEPAAIKMVDRERGDLFAVCLPDRSLIVQMIEPLPDADKTINKVAAGVFAVTKNKPEELWLRVSTHGTFTRCRYLRCVAACSNCGFSMEVIDEHFVCSFCKDVPVAS